MKKLPIGISDFKKLIEGNNYFVDKSMFIYELINSNAEVSLIPRPRRFGKTLNISMLQYFFEVGEDNGYLFKDLAISKTEEFKTHLNKYPVIFLSFKDIKNSSFEKSFKNIKKLISKEYKKHYNQISTLNLQEREKNIIENIINLNGSLVGYENSLKLLSELLYKRYNQRLIILIDEYDTPMLNSYLYGYYNKTERIYGKFFRWSFEG